MDKKEFGNNRKRHYYANNRNENSRGNHNYRRGGAAGHNTINSTLQFGQKGFLITCNFQEKQCVRECYNILNEYADELYGPDSNNNEETMEKKESGNTTTDSESSTVGNISATATIQVPINVNNDDVASDDDDIATQLENQIKATNENRKIIDKRRFHQVNIGSKNIIFIKTTLDNPLELGLKIINDLAETKVRRSKFTLRFVPIETVCKAQIDDIISAAGLLFDEHFLNVPATTYSIIINKRLNNSVDNGMIIGELAKLVKFKNVNHTVDLKYPKTSILLEIIKNFCCISVLPNYVQLKRYNLCELASDKVMDDLIAEKNQLEQNNLSELATNQTNDKVTEEKIPEGHVERVKEPPNDSEINNITD